MSKSKKVPCSFWALRKVREETEEVMFAETTFFSLCLTMLKASEQWEVEVIEEEEIEERRERVERRGLEFEALKGEKNAVEGEQHGVEKINIVFILWR